MNSFTDRQQKIIEMIASSKTNVTCDDLIAKIGFSRRTILNEIKAINAQRTIILSSNRGYLINEKEYSTMNPDNVLSVKEEHTLLRRLVMIPKQYTFGELADKMFVSESTLNNMLKSMGPFLDKFSLSIRRENNFVHVDGNEYNKRKLINYLINEEIDSNFKSIMDIEELDDRFDYVRISDCIRKAVEKYNCYIDNNYRWNLELNIIIALYRIGSSISIDTLPEGQIDHSCIEYKIASDICHDYENRKNVPVSENDIVYIALQLMGQLKKTPHAPETAKPLVSDEFVNTIDRILFETYNYYMIGSDYHDFLYTFAVHLDAMIRRIRADQTIINDMLENLKKNSPFIYEVAVHIAMKLEKIYSIVIPEEEIGFIAVHIGFSINNSFKDKKMIKIQLLGNDYYKTIELLRDYILSSHSDQVILKVTDISTVSITIDPDTDLIITTKDLNILGKKVVVVSPFNSMMDHFQIDNAITEAIEAKEKAYRQILYSTFFHENLFFKNNDCHSKEEAIRFLGNKLEDFGIADKGFTESALEREKLSSTCFFDSFAIPHSLETDTKQSMFCVLVSEEGIQWDDHLIHIVLMIAVQLNDRKEFMNIYNGIIRTLWDQDKLKRLITCDNLSDFIVVLK